MKPLYILNTYSNEFSRSPATPDDITEFIDGRRGSYERLARVSLDPADGAIIVSPLADEDIAHLRHELREDQELKLRALLDASAAMVAQANAIAGVSVFGSPFTVWPENIPWGERVVRAWAEERGHTVADESPPREGQCWIRTARVLANDREVARIQWPSVTMGDTAIAVEVMCRGIAKVFAPDVLPPGRVEEAF